MRPVHVWIALLVSLVTACGGAAPKSAAVAPKPVATIAAPSDGASEGAFIAGRGDGFAPSDWGGVQVDAGDAIPVTPADPTWGSPTAPVTLVEFADFQCPYCARAAVTLSELRRTYGPDKLRIVWKHDPLPFHEHARQAADLGAGIFAVGGSEAFFAYVDNLYAMLLDRDNRADFPTLAIGAAATAAEKVPARFAGRALMDAAEGPGSQKVDADLALAEKAGVKGTPAFFVNGVLISGAQPVDAFKKVIDDELAAASDAEAHGTARTALYATRLADNVRAGRNERKGDVAKAPEVPDTTVWRVPVGTSPVRGKSSALVTIVAFSDFQCPFCRKASGTLAELTRKYGDKLRIVYKHNPLPFHEHAEPAAELSMEVYKRKGNDAFWKVHDALFALDAQHMGEQDLEEVGKNAGLDARTVASVIEKKKHAAEIQIDQDLAEDLDATGTPTFFVNGRKLTGAQPVEKFSALIDEQLGIAEAKVSAGTPAASVYDALMKTAKAGASLETKTPPAVTSSNPTRGAAKGTVTLQLFSDFQCPFCRRVEPTLADLEKAFPGVIKVVWHNRPLPMHANAEAAAEAALEARKQKGDAGFWKMHDLMFADQDGLDRQGLEAKAEKAGLDLARFRAALDQGTHRAEVEADGKIADGLDIKGTPGILVDDYFVSGAQPLAQFKRAVRMALEKKSKKGTK